MSSDPTHPESWLGRFRSKFTIDPGGCWRWRRPRMNGYGYFYIDGRELCAHRVSYEHHIGPIPSGLVIDHLCRTPACVNPAHLEVVTPRENTRRGKTGGFTKGSVADLCLRRHDMSDPRNVYINPKGYAECRSCQNERDREARRLRREGSAGGNPDHPESWRAIRDLDDSRWGDVCEGGDAA